MLGKSYSIRDFKFVIINETCRKFKLFSKMLALLGRPNSYSLSGVDYIICNIFKKKQGFFVELGANDGLQQSNTLKLEREFVWSGILIEPSPKSYSHLLKNRKGNKIINAACVPFEFSPKTIRLFEGGLMSTTSLSGEEIPNYGAWPSSLIKSMKQNEVTPTFESPAMTLESILALTHAPARIDFLSLDVEGAELQVLSGLDHQRYRFNFILIESRNLEKTINCLSSWNYGFIGPASKNDLLFKDNLYRHDLKQ